MNIQAILNDYCFSEFSVEEIIEHHKIHKPYLYQLIRKHGVKRIRKSYSNYSDTYLTSHKHGYSSPYDLIKTEYANGKSTKEIAKMLNMTKDGVLSRMKKYNIPRRSRGGARRQISQIKIYAEYNGYKSLSECIFDLYYVQFLTDRQIADKARYKSRSGIRRLRKTLGMMTIPLWYRNERNNRKRIEANAKDVKKLQALYLQLQRGPNASGLETWIQESPRAN